MSKKAKDRRTLQEVLQSTSDVLFPAELGDTALHVLVWRKDRYGVHLLIEAGADVNAVGEMGETPLHAAVTQKEVHIIESLLKAGAKSDIRSEFGTASEYAKRIGGPIEKLLMKFRHPSRHAPRNGS
jgi:ankyrin repeat protein